MNPRILELQHQAMSLVLNGNDPDGDVEKMYIPAEFTKKLAELLIRKCAQISEDDITDGDACCTNTAYRISRQIKKHFGVEE
jgi:hypothetical protein